jgi:hypothetical protein
LIQVDKDVWPVVSSQGELALEHTGGHWAIDDPQGHKAQVSSTLSPQRRPWGSLGSVVVRGKCWGTLPQGGGGHGVHTLREVPASEQEGPLQVRSTLQQSQGLLEPLRRPSPLSSLLWSCATKAQTPCVEMVGGCMDVCTAQAGCGGVWRSELGRDTGSTKVPLSPAFLTWKCLPANPAQAFPMALHAVSSVPNTSTVLMFLQKSASPHTTGLHRVWGHTEGWVRDPHLQPCVSGAISLNFFFLWRTPGLGSTWPGG